MRPFLITLSASILIILSSACRKTEVGVDIGPAEEADRSIRFCQELFPLVLRVRHAPIGPDPAGDSSFCGDLELLKGDRSLFPDQNDLVYRYRPEENCSTSSFSDPRGALRIAFRGKMDREGSLVEIEGERFRTSGVLYNGNFRIHRMKGHWSYEWSGTRMRSGGEELRMVGDMKLERLRGGSTDSTVMDDRYRFDPDLKGEGIGEESYELRASERIVRDMGCSWPENGILWVKPRDLGARELVYGVEEGCSEEARVDVNGRSFGISLE